MQIFPRYKSPYLDLFLSSKVHLAQQSKNLLAGCLHILLGKEALIKICPANNFFMYGAIDNNN